MKIVVIGSINMDYVLHVANLPKKGETITALNYHISPGGKGANQAVAAKRLGADVLMIGALGNDSAGLDLCNRLDKEGIDVSGILFTDTATGNAMITVDEKGSNTIVVFPGANAKLEKTWVGNFREEIKKADCVIIQLEIPMETVAASIAIARSYGTRVILNPAPAKEIPLEIYRNVDIITPNETELAKLTGTEDINRGAKILMDRGVQEVVVTLGDKGSYYLSNERELIVKPVKVNAIDSTAAGDSFNAALAVGLNEKLDMEASLQFSNIVGALTTTKIGAQNSLPYRDEVDRFKK
ncbi:MAG: ribokinase [Clostridiales bacterium]|jgi:ribokinase|nr:ribokinase [Clostridiales bacterium]